MKTFFLLMAFCLANATSAHAELMVFTGDGGQKLTIESATEIHHDSYLVKIEGVESPWVGKAILLEKQHRPSYDRYVFAWSRKNKEGKTEDGEYQMLIPGNGTLKEGSIVKTMKVYYRGGEPDHPLVVALDPAATKAAKPGALAAEYGKEPFKPQP